MKRLLVAAHVAAGSLLAAGALAAQAPDGQAVYRSECRVCHGTVGKPTQMALNLHKGIPTFDSTFFATRTEDSIVAVLNHGAGKDMKSFKDKLSVQEILAVAKYVKETFGSGASH